MKRAMALISLSMAFLILEGCGSGSARTAVKGEEPMDLAIVCCARSNAPAPAIASTTVSEAILSSTRSYGSISIIVPDGTPFVSASFDIKPPDRGLSEAKRETIAQQQAGTVTQKLSEARAVSSEADLLAAIMLAARSLSNTEGSRYMLIMDSGLSTAGYVDFTDNLLRSVPDSIVGYVEQNKALPDLSGVSVLWVGLGDVAGEQEPLTPSNLEALREIWTRVLQAAGAETIEFQPDLPGTVPVDASTLPYVTTVPILMDDPFQAQEMDVLKGPVVLDEGKIRFLPDSAEFEEPQEAKEALRPIAECLVANPSIQVVLAGTTATAGSNEECKAFSRTRAEAAKAVLLQLGVKGEQIARVVGLGYDHEYHIPDLDRGGNQNENAPANRSVIIASVDSVVGANLLGFEE